MFKRIKFILEYNEDEKNEMFDSIEEALSYVSKGGKDVYLIVMENGIYVEQYKINMRSRRPDSELAREIETEIKKQYPKSYITPTNYQSPSIRKVSTININPNNVVKFLRY